MAKGKKKSNSADNDIEAYRHEKETRKNAVPVGLASYDTAKPKPKKYEYDPHLEFLSISRFLSLNSAKKTALPSKSLTTGGMR